MRQQLLIFLFASFGMTLQSCIGKAEVPMPKILKYVRVDTETYLYKEASKSSTYLVSYQPEDEEMIVDWASDEIFMLWKMVNGVHAEVVPVISEVEDWYQVYFSTKERWGPSSFSGIVYVPKNACHEVKRTPVKASAEYLDSSAYNAQKHTNEYFLSISDGSGDLFVMLGRFYDGYCLLFNGKEYVGLDDISFIKDQANLTNEEIQQLLPLFSNQPSEIYYSVEGDDEWYSFKIEQE